MPFPLLKAPFPWFGGKSRVSHIVWDHFGDVRNYVEPFAGSLAVLLGRPTEPKIETVNDLDCFLSNFWRSLQHDPEQIAAHADWPVNEADLHSRHLWLVNQADFRERMKTDPDYYDVKIAGWWVWGLCQWIGSGWCNAQPRSNVHSSIRGLRADGTPGRVRPHLTTEQGIQTANKRPYLTNHGGGMGVHRPNLITPDRGAAGKSKPRGINGLTAQKRPRLDNDNGRVALSADVMIASGPRGTANDAGVEDKGGLYEWFYALADRLRRVRVCCGDWKRVLGPAPTTCIGTTGVFLDPPYAVEERSDVYNEESRDVAHEVREWAIQNGDNPDLRIALCGYEADDYRLPHSWSEVGWKANGGYGNQANEKTTGRENAGRERIWFSPYCLTQPTLFGAEDLVASEVLDASL